MQSLRDRATGSLAGGVAAGWNHFGSDGPTYIARAAGCTVRDVDGTSLVDYVMGWGSLILGHNPPAVAEALRRAVEEGFGFEYEAPATVELAEAICSTVPSAELVRLANSGLEATLYAIRLARAATGRTKVLKFQGHFHGLHDGLLWDTDTAPRFGEVLPGGIIDSVPGSSGIPAVLRDTVVTVPYNDCGALSVAIERYGSDLAAVILEPISLNVGCIAPDPGYLEFVREITRTHGIVLIFDEVLTGYRVALGGAQALTGVMPDLTCLSKAMSGGLPVAAVAGQADLMQQLTPAGQCEMSGTNTGRHFAVLGALAVIRELKKHGTYDRLDSLNRLLVDGLREVLARRGVPAFVDGYGGRVGIYIGSEERPRNIRDVARTWDCEFHMRCYQAMRPHAFGFMLPLRCAPEAVTVSLAHFDDDVLRTLDDFDRVLSRLPYVAKRAE